MRKTNNKQKQVAIRQVEGMKVKEFIHKLQQDKVNLDKAYEDKVKELEALREREQSRSLDYTKGNPSVEEAGKDYLNIVKGLMQVETDESRLLKEMRGIILKTENHQDLLTAYQDYQNQLK